MKATMRGLLLVIVSVLTASAIALAQEPASPPRGQRIVGFFVGTLPCADCSGILTELTLFSHDGVGNATYRLKETHLGTPAKGPASESAGIWALEISRGNSKERVYRLVEARSLDTRVFLKVGDDELRVADREGRAIGSQPNDSLKRRPVPEKPFPHAPPPGAYLVGFYTGTLPCPDCEGIRVELTLFAGTPGRPKYWLKETRTGKPDGEATVESSGMWITRRNQRGPGLLIDLHEASQVFLEITPGQLKLIKRWTEEFSSENAGSIARDMALPFGTRWYDAFGCGELSRGGIDSVGGSVKCGETVIGFDMHGSAGDWCGGEVAMDLSSVGRVPMKMCLLDQGPSARLAVSLPDQAINLFVERATPRDTMVLMAMARNLADLVRAEHQSSSPSTNQDSRRPSRKMR
jgi:copper homeostasis protein (lipoprotein)